MAKKRYQRSRHTQQDPTAIPLKPTKPKLGAPLKWTEETIDKTVTPALHKYIDECIKENKLPLENEFAFLNHLNRCDFDDKFAVRSESFRSALRRLREYQKTDLVRGGLTERYNSHFTQFVLRNRHKDEYSDEQKIALEGNLPLEVKITHGVNSPGTPTEARG